MDEVKSMDRKCSVCKQARTAPRYGFPGATCASLGIKFKTATCKLCGTSSVCMDCLHERECCESKSDQEADERRMCPLFLAGQKE